MKKILTTLTILSVFFFFYPPSAFAAFPNDLPDTGSFCASGFGTSNVNGQYDFRYTAGAYPPFSSGSHVFTHTNGLYDFFETGDSVTFGVNDYAEGESTAPYYYVLVSNGYNYSPWTVQGGSAPGGTFASGACAGPAIARPWFWSNWW